MIHRALNRNQSSLQQKVLEILVLITVVILVIIYFLSNLTSGYQTHQNLIREELRYIESLIQSNLTDALTQEKFNEIAYNHVYQPTTIQSNSKTPLETILTQPIQANYNTPKYRDLLLGMAVDTDPKNMAVFIKSFRTVSNATVIIFIEENLPQRTQTIIKDYNIRLIPIVQDTIPKEYQTYHPSSLRWILFHNYFIDHPNEKVAYDRIWMIDVRDSFFQLNPFDLIDMKTTPSELQIFTGVEGLPIRECQWNGGWIRDCFDSNTYNRVKDKDIICSGVVAGKTDVVLHYISIMNHFISGKQQLTLPTPVKGNFPTCERNGVDQGTHNVIIHTNLLYPYGIKKWNQRTGRVANMQARLMNIQDNHVINSKQQLAMIVHQYDRFPDYQKYLFQNYVDWINVNDLSSEWKQENECENYQYKENEDLFFGRCDMKSKGGATSAASCCKHCNLLHDCKAFTFYAGSCFLKSCNSMNNKNKKPLIGTVSGYKK